MSLFAESSKRLHDKVVLITGASSGIGKYPTFFSEGQITHYNKATVESLQYLLNGHDKAAAVLFAKAGANVIAVARRQDALEETLRICRAAHKSAGVGAGGKFAAVQLDMSKREQIAGLLARIPSDLREVDVLVNNAGAMAGVERVGNIADADINAAISINLVGLIALTQVFVKDFKARNMAGHIINIGSIVSREPCAGEAIYTATKFAVRGFEGALMRELVDTPIRVSDIQPGLVETEFWVNHFRGDEAAAAKVHQGLRTLTPEDVAEEIVWTA